MQRGLVFNKTDRLENGELLQRFLDQYPHAVGISARDGTGLEALKSELGTVLRPIRDFVELRVPHEAAGVIARLHAVGQVVERDYNGSAARLKVRIPPHLRAEFAAFIHPGDTAREGARGTAEALEGEPVARGH